LRIILREIYPVNYEYKIFMEKLYF